MQKKHRPWLTPSGVEISKRLLRDICRYWSQETWSSYLKWYESPLKESIITPVSHEKKGNQLTQSVFEQFDHDTSQQNRELCDRLLSTLPGNQANVLRLKFLQGRTEREIAAIERNTKTTVHRLKNRALSRLRWGHDGEKWTTRPYIEGEDSNANKSEISIWNTQSFFSIRETKVYDPKKQKEDFENIQQHALKIALNELSENQKKVLYLRFWCDYSMNQIAGELGMGVNLVEQFCEAAVSKLKRKVIKYDTGFEPGGDPSCA